MLFMRMRKSRTKRKGNGYAAKYVILSNLCDADTRSSPLQMVRKYMRAVSIDVKKSGGRIRAVAEEKGYKPEQIQRELQLGTVRAVYLWYEGKRLPTADNLLLLARLFQVPMDSLVVGINDDQWTDGQIGNRIEEIFQWAASESRQTQYMKERYTYFSKDGVAYLLPPDMVLE